MRSYFHGLADFLAIAAFYRDHVPLRGGGVCYAAGVYTGVVVLFAAILQLAYFVSRLAE